MSVRKFYTTVRILKSGFVNLFRNAWLTVAATAVMVVALTIILIAVVLNITANNAIDEIALDLKAEVYFQDDASDSSIDAFQQDLGDLDFVVAVEYISREQANEDLTARFEDRRPELLQALALAGGANEALPASVRVAVNDLERMPEIKTFAEADEYESVVEEVSLGKDENSAQETIDKAAAGQRFINVASVVSAAVLSGVSVMIIFNTIRMAIYTRRDEIRIMKLIGATPDYIRGPFLVEASLYGVFAGIIACGAVYTLIFTFGKRLSDTAEFAQTYAFFTQPGIILAMLGSAILVGILIGSVSSMMAMEKHLKLKHW